MPVNVVVLSRSISDYLLLFGATFRCRDVALHETCQSQHRHGDRSNKRRYRRDIYPSRQCHAREGPPGPTSAFVRLSIAQPRCPGRACGTCRARWDARTTRVWSRRNQLRSDGQPGTVRRPGRQLCI